MHSRPIPGTDILLSPLAFGGWLTIGGSVDEATSLGLLRRAVAGGVTFLDLADIYSDGAAEKVVGKFLRETRASELVISSKVYWPTSDDPKDRGLSRRHIHASIDRSLQRLGCERLDLYFCHREDPEVPLAETVQAMGDLVTAGKARAWGTSCWRPSTLRAAHRLASQLGVAPPRVEQPPYSLLARWTELDAVPACRELGMALVVFSPLANGALTGKYLDGKPAGSRGATSEFVDRYLKPEHQQAVRAFVAACKARNLSPASVALAWLMQRPGITSVIMGATSEPQLQQNMLAAELQLDAAFLAELDGIFPPSRRSWWRQLARRLLRRA